MHLIVVRLVNGVYDFFFRTFTYAGSAQRAMAAIFTTASVLFSQVAIVTFYFLEKYELALRALIVVLLIVIGESFALGFVFSEVWYVSCDLVCL